MITAEKKKELRKEQIGTLDDLYPATVSMGHGYSREKAAKVQAQQEKKMRESPKTIDIVVTIEPIGDKYCVRNSSTYIIS